MGHAQPRIISGLAISPRRIYHRRIGDPRSLKSERYQRFYRSAARASHLPEAGSQVLFPSHIGLNILCGAAVDAGKRVLALL